MRLEAPDGTVVDASGGLPTVAAPGGRLAGRPAARRCRCCPAVDHAGVWTAVLSIDRKRLSELQGRRARASGVADGAARCRTRSSSRREATSRLEVKHRARRARADLVALLDAYGIPFWGEAGVVAVRNGSVRQDAARCVCGRAGAGRFTARAAPFPTRASTRCAWSRSGELDGQPFTREQIVSIPTVSGEPSEGATRARRAAACAPAAEAPATDQGRDGAEGGAAAAAAAGAEADRRPRCSAHATAHARRARAATSRARRGDPEAGAVGARRPPSRSRK